MIELFLDPQIWIAFFTLTALELVLGIDNIVFISILADKLPASQRLKARRLGLFLAMFMRIALLFVLSYLVAFTNPIFSIATQTFSGRDVILLAGGLFLLWKSTKEIHHLVFGEVNPHIQIAAATFSSVILQIIIIDAVFSFDSIITAVGLVEHIEVMIAAVITAVVLMMLFAEFIGNFVSQHPTVKMLALVFLFMIAVVLIADGLHHHIPKGYIYFAMAFSLIVEALNIRRSTRRESKDGKVKCIRCPNRILPETAKRNRGFCGQCHKKSIAIQDTNVEIDDAEFCYINNLPDDYNGTHIGMFLAWVIKNDLISEAHLKKSYPLVQAVRNETMTGRKFLMDICDDRLCTADLNETGKHFTAYYYQSDLYLEDYELALSHGLETIFHVKDSWENFHKISPIIDQQYEKWQKRNTSWLPEWD